MTKEQLRERIKEERRYTPQEELQEMSKKICTHLKNKLQQQSGMTCLLYFPLPTEVDITPLIADILTQQGKIFIPIVQKTPLMSCLPVSDMGTFQTLQKNFIVGKKKTLPTTITTVSISELPPVDFCLVPSLALDISGQRLGHGQGYYDRFLQHLQQQHPQCPLLAPQFSQWIYQNLPHDPWDIPVIPVSEEGIFHTKSSCP